MHFRDLRHSAGKRIAGTAGVDMARGAVLGLRNARSGERYARFAPMTPANAIAQAGEAGKVRGPLN